MPRLANPESQTTFFFSELNAFSSSSVEKQQSFQKHEHSQLKAAEKRAGTKIRRGGWGESKVLTSFSSLPHTVHTSPLALLQTRERSYYDIKANAAAIGTNTDVWTSRVTLTWSAGRWRCAEHVKPMTYAAAICDHEDQVHICSRRCTRSCRFRGQPYVFIFIMT